MNINWTYYLKPPDHLRNIVSFFFQSPSLKPKLNESKMNDIIAELRELNETVPCPLELPDEDALLTIEEELLMKLPGDLKEYLLLASDVIYGSLEPVTAADSQSHTYLSDVAAMAWEMGVPRAYIPICQIDDNYYCLTMEGPIVYWVNGKDTDQTWDSIWDWIEQVWMLKGIE